MKHLKESAQFSEEFIRRVVASSPDCIKVLDLDGHLLSMNERGQKVLEIVDLTPHIGTCWTGWWGDGSYYKDALAAVEAARLGGMGHFEAFAETFGGTPKWWDVTVSPILGADGQPEKLLSVSRDVTRRKLAEQKLAEAQAEISATAEAERARLASVFKNSPSFMAVLIGPEHVFALANDRYLQLVGHRDLLHKPVREALPEVAGQGFFELLDEVYTSGVPFVGQDVPIMLQRQAGEPEEERFVDFVYQPTFEGDGGISGILVHGVDRTERKTAETALAQIAEQRRLALDALHESEAQFRQLADAMPQMVWAARSDGFLDYYNQRWYDYTGLPVGGTGDKSWEDALHPGDVAMTHEIWGRSIRTGKPYEIEYRYRRAVDGEFRWHLGLALPIHNPAGEIVRWFGTATDIHERRQLQEQNEQLLASERSARSEAERTSQMKDEFLATLSHELRTPLNAILGWAQVLRDGDADPEDLNQGLATIERNARAQTQIIEDLLDMSKIISGKVRLDVQRLDLVAALEGAIETMKPTADTKGVRLLATLDPQACVVSGDPNRLQQVFWNLLSNAIKFTPKGGRVQTVLERVNSHLEISIIDSGQGIKAEFLPHVFDRFRQQDASTTRQHGGLGLGLAIVKQLVELHGGNVRVKSPGEGRGTTFIVALPLTVLHPEAEPPESGRRHPQAATSYPSLQTQSLNLQGVKVLVVDDEADARDLVKRLLEDRGASVRTAGSVADALRLFTEERPDVLVSDIGMPGEDGYALIRQVRALAADQGGTVPAVALTAYARAEDRMKAILAGFQMHVSKPVEPAELLTMVASLSGRAGNI